MYSTYVGTYMLLSCHGCTCSPYAGWCVNTPNCRPAAVASAGRLGRLLSLCRCRCSLGALIATVSLASKNTSTKNQWLGAHPPKSEASSPLGNDSRRSGLHQSRRGRAACLLLVLRAAASPDTTQVR